MSPPQLVQLMESVETINQRLEDHYGTTDDGRPIFRVVWSDEQVEKRIVTHLDSGVELLYPEPREVKKYPYIRALYVLERLVLVPEVNQKELLGLKTSYEPIWTFCDAHRNPLPPIWNAAKLVVDTLYAALGKASLVKYLDVQNTPEAREKRITELETELFGNESSVTDALTYKEGVTVPSNFVKSGE